VLQVNLTLTLLALAAYYGNTHEQQGLERFDAVDAAILKITRLLTTTELTKRA
jgi:hypothetical protein